MISFCNDYAWKMKKNDPHSKWMLGNQLLAFAYGNVLKSVRLYKCFVDNFLLFFKLSSELSCSWSMFHQNWGQGKNLSIHQQEELQTSVL